MAKIFELNEARWNEWVASRPECIQALCKRLPPDRLYRLEPPGQYVTIVSYSENGTVTVAVSAAFNAVMFEREVFGINPDELTECDLPPADHPTGSAEDMLNALLGPTH